MNIIFGTHIHKAQLVMELNISQLDDKKIADKIIQGNTVISIQHFIAGDETPEAAVIIWDGEDLESAFIGFWKLDHSVQNKYIFENYFQFTAKCEVKSFALEIVDENTDEHYLYYTFNNYKKL